MSDFDREAFGLLVDTIRDAARLARDAQRGIGHTYKSDGSVLTETDLKISALVRERVHSLFPECTFICEETEIERKKDSDWIFVLDPVDGTDVYSQGLPCYAVALGILDADARPVGAIIDAPRFGIGQEELLVTLCPGESLHVDGEPFTPAPGKDAVHQVTMGSTDQESVDFTAFRGKVRTFGSSIIHLLSPVVFPSIQGCVNQPCYVWDVAASHAVLLSVGMEMRYCDRRPFVYTDSFLYEKTKFDMEVYAGLPAAIDEMSRVLPVKAL